VAEIQISPILLQSELTTARGENGVTRPEASVSGQYIELAYDFGAANGNCRTPERYSRSWFVELSMQVMHQ
jgi:hypothetical protein